MFNIREGQQIFVRKVLLSGLHYTRPDTVAKAITLKPGDPLNQTALAETQRNLYEFALFNEVNTAVRESEWRGALQNYPAADHRGAALDADVRSWIRGTDRHPAE